MKNKGGKSSNSNRAAPANQILQPRQIIRDDIGRTEEEGKEEEEDGKEEEEEEDEEEEEEGVRERLIRIQRSQRIEWITASAMQSVMCSPCATRPRNRAVR